MLLEHACVRANKTIESKVKKMKKIIIFDTTLRDGEQSPGASMNMTEKLQVARQLERLGVDIVEAGFPIASNGDFEAVKMVAKELKKCSVCGLARANKKDIDRCWEAVKNAVKPRIHTFIATSPIHRKSKLKMTKKQVIEKIRAAVKLAKSYCDDVEFSAEDATRTEIEFLKQAVKEAVKAGANTINIPDTVGYTMPSEYAVMIKEIKKIVPDDVIISVHCHNDLGMASANSLVAVQNGAGQIECTVNGIGERAGNASLEEIIMSIVTRKDIYRLGVNIDTKQIYPASSLVSRMCGIEIQKNKAIVGDNAFRHEAGIHQHGVLQNKLTYEIMTPESIGRKVDSLVLGKHSGRHALKERLKALSVDAAKLDMDRLFEKFKEVADKKKQIYDDELLTMVDEQLGSIKKTFELEYLHAVSGSKTIPSATVRIKVNKGAGKPKVVQEASAGDGPVDACYKAVDKITGLKCILADYRIKAVSRGRDSLGEVTIIIKEKEGSEQIHGRGASTDIIEASALAYISALNRLWILKKQKGTKRKSAQL
ncbi:2-isopropylmalate synthase [Elusimicrobiota bacterium]